MAITRKLVNLIFVVVLVVTLFVGVTPPVLADQDSNEGSFSAYVFKDGEWQLQGVLHFSDYETFQMQLSNYKGQLKLRLVQEGHDGAYIDQAIVQKYGIPYLPLSAVNIDNNTDVLAKILYPEYDVCNGWHSTLEIIWDNAPENATLVMRAMEEDLGEGHGAPMYYPWPYEHRTLSHLLVNNGGITVDGLLGESTEPDFSVFCQPYSPHPDGYTYGWIHCDNKYLYAAVEVTGDNTADEGDWGALYIIVNGKQKEFRVSNDQTWGIRGFQYTSSVPYEHRIYEFKIPLNEINAVAGSEIHYIFGAYGTYASLPLTFDTVPANTGSIVFDGSTYYDGDVYPLGGIGPYNIEAKPAPGYVFVEWQVEGGISVDDPYSNVAHLSVIGESASTLRMVQGVITATGTGTATFTTSNGAISGLTATASTPCGTPASGLSFLHGFFSFSITNITPGSTVTVTITLPSDMPTNTQYWKCINGQWVNATSILGDNDGDNILTLTITDGGPFDADGQANGTIVDPCGPAVPLPTVTRVSPNSGVQGQTLGTIITGTNFTGATAVSFGAGITVNSFAIDSATQITASITIAGNAAIGARDISVTTPFGTGTLTGGFTVNPSAAPAAKPRVSPRSPASMSVQYMSINPKQAYANQSIIITTNVVNTGDEAGSLGVVLKINGNVEQTRLVTVGPHGTQPVKFTVTKAQPGTYDVDIGGQKGSFTILGAGGTSGTTGTSSSDRMIAILIIIGALVLATVVVVWLLIRRPA